MLPDSTDVMDPTGDLRNRPFLPQVHNKYDFIARFSGATLENVKCIATEPTETVASYFFYFAERVKARKAVLVEVIKKQKEMINYNGFYTSFLLGQITEENFDKIDEDFACSIELCDDSEIEEKTLLLLSETGLEFSTSDLSYFWGCSDEQIDAVLNKLENEKLIA